MSGERALLPKSGGIAVMMSALASRNTGLGLGACVAMLGRVNLSCRGQTRVDKHAAEDTLSAVEKKDLAQSPFVKCFELGANNEGRWGRDHMALQLEDCADCLKAAHPDFKFLLLFDHSSSHSKKRRCGLDAANTSSGFGRCPTCHAKQRHQSS